MKFLGARYSGLKFYYTFETADFVFIPAKNIENDEKNSLEIEEIFSCKYEKSSEFYVFLKEQQDTGDVPRQN